jgi:hypothetical protein
MTPIVQAPSEKLQRLRELQARAARIKGGVAKYYNDPVGFAADCIDWHDDGLTGYQQEIIGDLPSRKRISVRGPHGLGKGCTASVTVLWFALTRDAAGVDWKIPTTAGSWHQLTQYLWPEIRKWAGRLRWDKVRDGRPFTRNELQNLNLRLAHGHAFAGASANPGLIEGAHADSLLFIYDESKMIPAMTFDACEGAFSGTGEALALSLSTPGPPQGRFYDIQSRRPGYEDWHARHVTLDEALAAGRISPDWAAQRARQWGTESSIYVNRVLGEFHAGDEDSVIPLAWAEAAVERWLEWDLAGRPGTELDYPRTVGVDVARFGQDRTVLAVRNGHVLTELRRSVKEDTMATTGRVKGVLDADPARTAIVDVIGIGAGVVDRLREMGCKVQAFNASAGTDRLDVTGEFSYSNSRSAALWSLREQLDPSAGSNLCLPDDESKDEIAKRLGRSTDDGDACAMAYWSRSMPHKPSARHWAVHDELERMTQDPAARMRTRLGQDYDREDNWSADSFAPQADDGRPERPNVRSWR